MEQMAKILNASTDSAKSLPDWDELRLSTLNSRKVESDIYNCPICGNKGVVYKRTESGEIVAVPCKCKKVRESIRLMKQSGLESTIREQTFSTYKADQPWQQNILEKAKDYVNNPKGWFYIAGQVGCGKTHICTAIVREMLLKGKKSKYFPWREVSSIKGTHGDALKDALDALREVPVLYMDDFFKGGIMSSDGKIKPSAADINIAFEIINHRYINRDMITIFSSERNVEEIMEIDSAVGSRIYQKSKDHCIYVTKDDSKNYRLKL